MLSVLTPTYNRAYILETLFNSLKNQTDTSFEWIVVDDGSTDQTNELIEAWKLEPLPFELKYYKQQNGGKHRAVNKGVKHAQGEYVYILDSDDYIVADAVEKISEWIKSIEGLSGFAGVSGLRGNYIDGNLVPIGQYPKDREYIDASNLERRRKKLIGDKAEVYKKNILLKYPFPEFDNETFIPESVIWDKIAVDGFRIRWFGEIICICEYLEDGLTKSSSVARRLSNFEGYSLKEKLVIHYSAPLMSYLAAGRYYLLARRKGLSLLETAEKMEVSPLMIVVGTIIEGIKNIVRG